MVTEKKNFLVEDREVHMLSILLGVSQTSREFIDYWGKIKWDSHLT